MIQNKTYLICLAYIHLLSPIHVYDILNCNTYGSFWQMTGLYLFNIPANGDIQEWNSVMCGLIKLCVYSHMSTQLSHVLLLQNVNDMSVHLSPSLLWALWQGQRDLPNPTHMDRSRESVPYFKGILRVNLFTFSKVWNEVYYCHSMITKFQFMDCNSSLVYVFMPHFMIY